MVSVVGIVVVLGCIVAGYLMEHGNLVVLLQPAELVIILGSAVGAVIAANPLPVLVRTVKAAAGVLRGSPYDKKCYTESLRMIYDLFALARKMGAAQLEQDVDNPSKSTVFQKYPKFLKSHHAVHFLCDTLRVALSGGVDPLDVDAMMEVDLEAHHREGHEPVAALTTLADSLPGLGIVAAVLGIVLTMSSLGGAKEGDWREGGGRAGGNVLRCLALLRNFRPASRSDRKAQRSGGGILRIPSHVRPGIRQRS